MVAKNVVLESINNQGGDRCVDLFLRPDGSFGFGEFRRDVEDNRGWFPVGDSLDQVFNHKDDAFSEAQSRIPWLNDVLKDGFQP